MLLDLLFIAVGIANAVAVIWIARKFAIEGWMYTPTIVILPLIYVGFGFLGGSPEAVKLELLYGLPFFLIALLALKIRSASFFLVAGAAWLVHGFYDLFHDVFFVNPGVWFWYPAYCAGVDVAIGCYLLFAGKHIGNTTQELAH